MDMGSEDTQNSKIRRPGRTAFNSSRRIISLMEDRLSALTDDVVGLILSKIPTREAIRCSILSRRWRFAYTHIRELQLSPFHLMGPADNPPERERELVEDAISQILRLHSSHVEAFHLSIHDQDWSFTAEKVSRWVEYAAFKNVQRITLCQSPRIEIPPPAALFTCASLTKLKLSNYNLSNIPDTCVLFNHLLSCSFHNVQLTDDSLALFISRCPLLQRLSIKSSVGLLNPVITGPNIADLVIYDDNMKALTITCPKILSLKTQPKQLLGLNGVFFRETSCDVMEGTSSLVELFLDLEEDTPNFSAARFLDNVSNFKSLKILSILLYDDNRLLKEENGEMTHSFLKLLEMLPNLEVLYMGGLFAMQLDEDRIPECLSSPLANLRIVRVNLDSFDEPETAVLGCLLQSSPALEILEFGLIIEEDIDTPEYKPFVENLSSLKRASTQVTIRHSLEF